MNKLTGTLITLTAIGVAVKVNIKAKDIKKDVPTKEERLKMLNRRLSNQVDVLQESHHILQEWFVKEIEKNAVERYRILTKN